MKRRVRFGMFILWSICSFSYGQQEKASNPNVIVILADDIGVGDISAYRKLHSDKIILSTPNLDSLAHGGMMFTNGHSPAALCAPSRYAIMTGQITLGRLMQKAGYHTAFMGKWHLGGRYFQLGDTSRYYHVSKVRPQLTIDIRQIVDDGPTTKGFDESLVFPAGIQNVPYAIYENDVWMPLADGSEISHITQEKMDTLDVKLDKEEGLRRFNLGSQIVLCWDWIS